MFVEVKAGTIRYYRGSHSWIRELSDGRKETIRDPFDQARQSMHTLMKMINGHAVFRNRQIPFTYGYAVGFPGCRYSGQCPPDARPELIFDADRCETIRKSLEKAFEAFPSTSKEAMTPPQIQAIHEVLYPEFGVTPVLWKKVEDQEKRLKRLTREQERTFTLLRNQKTALIQGVAGSGKTILALAKAQEMARKGFRTLFLCYNRPLADWLGMTAEKPNDMLEIMTYHQLVVSMAKRANLNFRQSRKEDDEAFWNDRAPEVLIEATAILLPEEKYDAIVVDEGQDFHELWWLSLDGMFRDGNDKKCYYVFFDPLQNIYVSEPTLPRDMGDPFVLDENCRNTVKIAQHCEAIVGQRIPVFEGSPEGTEPEFLRVGSIKEAFRTVEKKIREWCFSPNGGLEARQVAVLADGSTKSDWPSRFGTFDTTESLPTWTNSNAILLDTWKRFKGLEADAVILIDTEPSDQPLSRANQYVARSRAKHLLTIIEVV